ncbi:DUF4865 family protein [Acholeplasma hippikon]|uniref:Uncharacterized protein n=1 Tax=Acholeplasma hippikon TaxID=264636 RepID=A0A449BIX5_9MOLU|nr:DUF4865 family protein [Acholeplasma hippikon]VEU82414.1 Uncharacterised protein [Acholeplasma hippikon]
MIGMQYRISFESNFDMNKIRERVFNNGYKTDDFPNLIFKLYLIKDGLDNKLYAPLYLFESEKGMNKFIFEGYYNNILTSFGWQKIDTLVPLTYNIENIKITKFVLEDVYRIKPCLDLRYPIVEYRKDAIGFISYYDTKTWEQKNYYFYEKRPLLTENGIVFECLHVSQSTK